MEYALDPDGQRNRQPLLVLAAESPRARAVRSGLVAEAGRRGVKVLNLKDDERVAAIDGAADACHADAIAVCGGGAVQGSVAAVAAGRDLPFACIPAGPDDLLARDIRADLDDPRAALTYFLSSSEHAIDLGEVNGIVFVNYVALGLRVLPLDRAVARGAQPGASLARARIRRGRPSGLRALRFGERGDTRSPTLLITNNRFALFGDSIGARARIDAGVLGVAILESSPREPWQSYAKAWRERSLTRIELAADGPVLAEIDGRRRRLQPPLRFRILPRALRVRTATRRRAGSVTRSG
jgi:diacylglycerol kinase family enzyme